MIRPDYEALRARVLAQVPTKVSHGSFDEAPFSTYVRYGKRMLEYVAAGCDLGEAFLLTHEEIRSKKIIRERLIKLVEWRLENVADREWSEPPSQYMGPWQTRMKEEGRKFLTSIGLPNGAIRCDGQTLLIGDGEDHRW